MDNETEVIIAPQDLVTVTDMGHLYEIQYLKHRNCRQTVQKIDANRGLVLSTGEIIEYQKSVNRASSVQGLRKTFKKLRYLINENFRGKPNELFCTLTFARDERGWRPSVNDNEYMNKCWRKFLRKMRKMYGNVEFIRVLEPHEDGHAHYHALFRFDEFSKIYIPNVLLRELWGMGYVSVESLKGVDNIGAYLSAYFTDIELTDENLSKHLKGNKLTNPIKEVGDKKYLKGARLAFYDSGKQIYNKSKGIKQPQRRVTTYEKAKKRVGECEPTYSKSYSFEIDGFENQVRFESYNLKRK